VCGRPPALRLTARSKPAFDSPHAHGDLRRDPARRQTGGAQVEDFGMKLRDD
jgi:hypothetical protein